MFSGARIPHLIWQRLLWALASRCPARANIWPLDLSLSICSTNRNTLSLSLYLKWLCLSGKGREAGWKDGKLTAHSNSLRVVCETSRGQASVYWPFTAKERLLLRTGARNGELFFCRSLLLATRQPPPRPPPRAPTRGADSGIGTFVCGACVSDRRSFPGTPSPLAPLRPPTRVPGAAGPELPGSSLLPRRSSGQARVRPGPRPRSPPDPRGCCTGCRSRCCCCRRGHPTLGPPPRRSWTHRPPRLPLFPRRKAPPPLLPRWRGRDNRGWAATCSSTPTGSPTRTRCSWRRNLGARRSARRPRESRVLARATAAQSAPVSLPALYGCRATACRTRTSSPLHVVLAAKPSSAPATCRGTAPPTARALAHRTPARSVHAASRTPRSWRSTCACTELRPALSGPPRLTRTASHPHSPSSAEVTALP